MNGFGLDHLPYGVVDGHCVVRFGDHVLDLSTVPGLPPVFDHPHLNHFLGLGRPVWDDVREKVTQVLDAGTVELDTIYEPELPLLVGDFVSFNGSSPEPGRAGSIVVSGTDVVRPRGAEQLEFELELAFVTGPGKQLGCPIAPSEAREHVFGFALVNNWNARDLGPYLGRSFATSMSAWITPLAALDGALELEVDVNGEVVARAGVDPAFPEQLESATANGAAVRPGDLFGHRVETERRSLADGDTVTLRGRVGTIELGAVRGMVVSDL